jgi:hypothetical protein
LKAGLYIFVLLFALAGNLFAQVSLDDFHNEWSTTPEKLKTILHDKKVVENKAKGLMMFSHEDVLEKIKVRVDYIFNKEGQLTAKTIGILSNEKDYKPLFDIFKNDAVKRYGSKYLQKLIDGKNSLIWQPDPNTRIFMSYGGFMVQYNILKNVKPKKAK